MILSTPGRSSTGPVLTEAFHMLSPASTGADHLREFIARGGATVWFFDAASLQRAFELMGQLGMTEGRSKARRQQSLSSISVLGGGQ